MFGAEKNLQAQFVKWHSKTAEQGNEENISQAFI